MNQSLLSIPEVIKPKVTPTPQSTAPTMPRATSQSSPATTAPVHYMSSVIIDTTAEHKYHMFDLYCKICTGGQKADEENESPETKKEEVVAKQEPEPEPVMKPTERPVLPSHAHSHKHSHKSTGGILKNVERNSLFTVISTKPSVKKIAPPKSDVHESNVDSNIHEQVPMDLDDSMENNYMDIDTENHNTSMELKSPEKRKVIDIKTRLVDLRYKLSAMTAGNIFGKNTLGNENM